MLPKSYIVKKYDDFEDIKFKGITKPIITLDECKKKFYSDETYFFENNQLYFNRSEYTIKQNYINKKTYLNSYNKRVFSKDKKTTYPINTGI